MTQPNSTADTRSFLDRQRDAALTRIAAEANLRRELLAIAASDNGRWGLTHVVAFADRGDEHSATVGTYVVKITDYQHRAEWNVPGYTYAVIHDGATDFQRFLSIDRALLYAVALRAGTATSEAGDASYYAARVLGINDPQ